MPGRFVEGVVCVVGGEIGGRHAGEEEVTVAVCVGGGFGFGFGRRRRRGF